MGGFISHQENMKRWKELIATTEDQLQEWKNIAKSMPYYENICKAWENFLDKQKDDYTYYMKINKQFD
jgi:hypothetical protein